MINNSRIFIAILNVLLPLFFIFVLYFLLSTDVRRKSKFIRKTKRKIRSIDKWYEFENIYNSIINDVNFSIVKTEGYYNILKAVSGYLLVIFSYIFIIFYILTAKNANPYFVSIIFLAIFFIGVALSKKKPSKYKKMIIKKFVSAINSTMKYEDEGKYYKLSSNLYKASGFQDQSSNRVYLTDYIEYGLDYETTVQMVDLHLQYRTTGKNRSTTEVFEGIVAKISREKNIDNKILIERNRFIKVNNRVKSNIAEFEKHFDVYAEDESNIEVILPESTKEQILELYKKYGIMFEISIKGKDIFVRFFTGGIFESIAFGTYYSKKKLYREYIIFTSILEIINEINELL